MKPSPSTHKLLPSVSSLYLVIVFHFLLDSGSSQTPRNENLTFGVILPQNNTYFWSLPKTRFAVEFALETIEKRQLLPGLTVRADYRDSKCSETDGPLEAIDMYTQQSAQVFLGPACDYAVAPIARFTKRWEIPVITAGALVKAFGNKREYPLLTRLMGPYSKVADFIITIFQHFNWKTGSLLYHDIGSGKGERSDCYFIMEAVYLALYKYTKQQPWFKSFDQNKVQGPKGYLEILGKAKLHARIFVICASPDAIRELMIQSHNLQLHLGNAAFFSIELFSREEERSRPWYRDTDTEMRNQFALEAFQNLMIVELRKPTSPDYQAFSDRIKMVAAAQYQHPVYGKGEVNSFVGAFHDAVILYALALNESLKAGVPITNGSEITRRMWNRTFAGITGNVSIDANGDSDADYCLLDFDTDTEHFHVVAIYMGSRKQYEAVYNRSVVWGEGRTEPPVDVPACGFLGFKCTDKFREYQLINFIMLSIMVVVIICSLVFYRNIKVEAELTEMTWRIDWEDVRTRSRPRSNESRHSAGSAASLVGLGSVSRVVSVTSQDQHSIISFVDLDPQGPEYSQKAYYDGTIVVIKKLQEDVTTIHTSLLQEIRKIRDLNNEHIARFVGACIDPPNQCLLIEYCPKGSLKDVLENDEMRLDWTFRFSIMQDIVHGLSYLHSTEIHSHGNLKSTNCVVDSRFVIKLTDFRLIYLPRRSVSQLDDNPIHWFNSQLWTAPEQLRSKCPSAKGTQQGDMYSLAVICQEIVYRQGVFYIKDMHLNPKEIYEGVKSGDRKPVLRPSMDVSDFLTDDLEVRLANKLKWTVQKCWSEDPSQRLSARSVKRWMRTNSQNRGKRSLMDSMLARLEHYAGNLEQLVANKTRDFLEEKQKAQDLLYSMLPESVAQSLIRGQSVVAETFESVTIYFSDICGFTILSASSTPMQVVALLNALYTMFDSILENFDVYKVETIGDAYMVVSGLPERNGKRHAQEIARMSLELLRHTLHFQIPHRPDERLQIRIGVHSGSVVAGVVGLKMPRYCLFGDTVNTTSRMESNGLPWKIHISQQTKDILDEFENFIIELRGEVEMKGKGVQTTYWLKGEYDLLSIPS